MILLLSAAFPLCIPECFARLQLLYQLLCASSLKKIWSRGTMSHVQARPLLLPPVVQELQNCITKTGTREGMFEFPLPMGKRQIQTPGF